MTAPQRPGTAAAGTSSSQPTTAQSRPDPVLGQLQPGGNYYGLIPLVAARSAYDRLVPLTRYPSSAYARRRP